MSVQLNEVVTNSARMIRVRREVDQRTQAIASAAEELVASTQEIAGILAQQTQASNEVAGGIVSIAEMTGRSVKQIESIVDFLAEVDRELVRSMDEIMTMQVPDMTACRGKSDHVIWKKRLAEMIVGRVEIDPGSLADHHSCRLGKWYDALKDDAIRKHPAFRALEAPHRQVHAHGIEAARLYKRGDISGAIGEIAEVAKHSRDVLRLLDELLQAQSGRNAA